MNKTSKNWTTIFFLWRRETFSSIITLWKEESENYIFPSKQFMIYIAGTHLVNPSVCKILKLIKNNAQYSLWRICEAVCLLPETVHVASINEFKSSKDKLLTLPCVTTCFNLWKFLRVSDSNWLVLWKKYFQKVTSQLLYTSQISKSNRWSLVLMISHMFTLIANFKVWRLYHFCLRES